MQRGSTVLLVEDHEPTRALVERVLASEGVRTLSVKNGVEALTFLERHRPDVIITDLIMPRLDGFSLTRLLKSRPATANIPVVLFTAVDSPETRAQSTAVGCDGIVTKPFHKADLIAALTRALGKRAAN